MKKICCILIFVLPIFSQIFGQQLTMREKGGIVRVMRGKQILYRVTLRGKPNEKGRKYDTAFLAGECLIVHRGIWGREVKDFEPTPPRISRMEVYQTNGKKKIYHQSDNFNLYLIYDHNLINSPDYSWAVIPENSEGSFWGYHHISSDCTITEVRFKFPDLDNFFWDGENRELFPDVTVLKIPSIKLANPKPDDEQKTFQIYITKDGKYRVVEVSK